MIKRVLFLAIVALSIALFMGCSSGPFAKHDSVVSSEHHDSFDDQTDSMRGEINHVKSSSSSSSSKKSSGKSGMIYGGWSSEAREIEDSLYGN